VTKHSHWVKTKNKIREADRFRFISTYLLHNKLNLFYFIFFLFKALVWQLMRAYTLAMLDKLAGQGHPIVETGIIEWANNKV
jgi:hypothetical protein